MRNKFEISLDLPEGVECSVEGKMVKLKKGDVESRKEVSIPRTSVESKGGKITLKCEKANKKDISYIKTNYTHLKNMLKGLDEKYIYEMEICHVHFPMNVKTEGNKVIINNFLGEKINREAKINEGVEVEIKGNVVTVSGNNIEKTGQTAANIEKASRVPNKDRRVFQDGIFITSKPGGKI
tara:strand:+ start:2350 stop:2892 length:543 start_codon:yes stop_codon:yes gene_type:complete